ncbi:MAG: hypothetical protein ACOC5R_00855 [Elusimicrobiota bacterium]
MKKGFLLVIILGLFIVPLYAQEEGKLDLPDVFIWGEDRSIFPGISKGDIFDSPYLDKDNFLKPISVEQPTKTDPKELFQGSSGLSILGGGSLSEEYYLRVFQERNSVGDWFYGYKLQGKREFYDSPVGYYSNVGGGLNFGMEKTRWGFQLQAEGFSEDSILRKDGWGVRGETTMGKSNLWIKPEAGYQQISEENKLSRYCFGFESGFDINHNHKINGGFTVRSLETGDEKIETSDLDMQYTNTVFRDFSFVLGGGLRDDKKNKEVKYKGILSGDIASIGYKVYYKKKYNTQDVLSLYKKYNFLNISGVYKDEEEEVYGAGVVKRIGGFGDICIDFNRRNINNLFTLIDESDGLIPYNIDENIEFEELRGKIRTKWLTVGYTKKFSERDLPYLSDEFRAGIHPEFKFSSQNRSLFFKLWFEYIPDYYIWNDKKGSKIEKISSGKVIDVEFGLKINPNVVFRIGGENLLSEELFFPGGFTQSGAKFYAMLEISMFKNKKVE